MKYRMSQWLDTSDMNVDSFPILYGIQANTQRGIWRHCHEDGKPLIFKSAEECSAKIEQLRAADKAAIRDAAIHQAQVQA